MLERIDDMCNLSEGIVKNTVKETEEKNFKEFFNALKELMPTKTDDDILKYMAEKFKRSISYLRQICL